MQVLFVHGMGRSSLSAWPMLRRLRQAGFKTRTFGYSVALENFDAIVARLRKQIVSTAARGDYIVVGHSLGGVLLRATLNSLPQGTTQPRHAYLLGSPMRASQMAQRFRSFGVFRMITGDCGQLLSTPSRMNAIGALTVPTTGIIGVGGVTGAMSPFGNESNDGIVTAAEADAPWLSQRVHIRQIHTLLPSSNRVAEIITRDFSPKV